jgi:antitoxin (DNA-binding transcriptional repressor) of toxin-antitoxin stability system
MRAKAMKMVSLSEAQANITELLKHVERGETVQISPDGTSVGDSARAFDDERRTKSQRAIEAIIEARKTAPHVTTEEILQWRDEGRR